MSDQPDGTADKYPPTEGRRGTAIEDPPVVTCSSCGGSWTLEYEFDELHAGNRAVEQFALDHQRHTGHFPDAVTPWIVTCRQCPAGEAFLAERPADRWARTHERHTRHDVELEHGVDREEIGRRQSEE